MKSLAAVLTTMMILSIAAWGQTPSSQPATQPTAIPFDIHDGYFVSNKFEPNEPESFVVLKDQTAFDQVFGTAFVMNDKSHRLPANAFEAKMVLAVVHRGKATWEYAVQGVSSEKGVLTIRYTATSKPSDSTEFACPLLVSMPKADYAAVEFVENGKVVKRIGAAASRPTTRPVDANAVAELVGQLGDNDLKVREEATEKLKTMGLAVIPLLTAKFQEPNLDPEVAIRIEALLETPRESQAVRENGVSFQIIAPAVLVLEEGASVPLALKVTNHTDQTLQFNLLDTVAVHIKDAAGNELLDVHGVRLQSFLPKPLLVDKDQSGNVNRIAKWERTDKGFRLTGSDGAGGEWYFDGLAAGKYTVSIAYENTQGSAGWIGKVTTKELAVEIVGKTAATTQSAAK
jgi:hypothetical protein